MSEVELLSPAGDFETALAAFEAGADAVYCGLDDFSARAFAKNLSEAELKSLVAYAHKNGKKVYVTFNTLIDESRLEDALEILLTLNELKVDALIVQDLGIAQVCHKHFPNLALHASTQMVTHNLEGVLALRELGFKRVVLARELSLAEISSIVKRCGEMEIECFIHGALCYSISGLCLFGAMEKGRSGNRGACPYCCRQHIDEKYPFSMRDLRLGEEVRKLVDAGVKSLKIEGRMKSSLYVASVTQHYRAILDGTKGPTCADLETVFSRRTTKLYLNGKDDAVIDDESLGHVGTEIGEVKKVTLDRDGRAFLRFHTARALEKHDGLQFEAMDNGRHLGLGIGEMRQTISRRPVFEVKAGEDVEVLVDEIMAATLKPGMKIYCSMSNAVKRQFPPPSFRPSDYHGIKGIKVNLVVTKTQISATIEDMGIAPIVSVNGIFGQANDPQKTREAAEKAFSKLGGSDYFLERISIVNSEKRFVPVSVLNELRRALVEKLDATFEASRNEKLAQILADEDIIDETPKAPLRTIKLRADQKLPVGEWSEVIRVMDANGDRVATPVWTSELEFNHLRTAVKKLIRGGCQKWECSDLATLRMLKSLGVTDITADWTLYAFNSRALKALKLLGIKRFVASPENNRENLQFLAESGYFVEFLSQQSTPLFISLTEPKAQTTYQVFKRDGLWVTTTKFPRTFELPKGVSSRIDLSWDE